MNSLFKKYLFKKAVLLKYVSMFEHVIYFTILICPDDCL